MSEGRFGGELDPYTAGAIRMVADPNNWRGLNDEQKADLQAEINKGLTKEQKRLVDALVKKNR